MKLPYGISDFYKLSTEGYWFTDRTSLIARCEEIGSVLLFLRPRRFGKSLWLSILENYYDVAKADAFDRLFGQLAIGKNPTPNHNQYLIMRWDFSAVMTHGDISATKQALHNHINTQVRIFLETYPDILNIESVVFDPQDSMTAFMLAVAATKRTPYKLYLLIDEYDNFANEVMMSRVSGSQSRYESLVHGEGLLRTVFKVVKVAASGRGLDRIFITGVSPIVMSDVTSAFNIVQDIFPLPDFNDLCGFWESEIERVLQQIVTVNQLPPSMVTEALTVMRSFYNGYTFDAEVDARLYNPTLALYFLNHFQRYHRHPRKLLDTNFATDRNKIAFVSHLPHGGQLIADALANNEPIQIPELSDRFGVQRMLRETHEYAFMVSLLYYLGVLTLDGFNRYGYYQLRIPNVVARNLYAERIREMLFPNARERDVVERQAAALFEQGDMQPLCDFMEQRYFKVFDNRDYRWVKEMTIKTAFLTLLFNDIFYIMDSETELERSYADLTMILRPDMRKYDLFDILIEFKYIKPKNGKVDGTEIASSTMEDLAQLKTIRQAVRDARQQARVYQQRLQAKYGDVLRLRSYVVVALGFERLVWESVPE